MKMCSTESICENKMDMDDSGFVPDLSVQDVSQCSQRVNLLDLSDDVLLYILRHCTPRDLKALGFSCSRLGRLVRERALWRRVDARSEPCSKARLQWLLDNVLLEDTKVLLLTGYARDAEGCAGFINLKRKEADAALNTHSDNENSTTERVRADGVPILDIGALGRHPTRLVIDTQRSRLPRQRCFPSWPEDGEVGRAGPQRCNGPQFTLSQALLQQLCTNCPHLTTLGLEYCNIDCSNTCLGTFPKTLKKLSLRGSKCYNMIYDRSFLFKIQDYLPLLQSLDVSECEWMDPATLLPLSKMMGLTELIMQDCHKLTEFVAYASLTSRYGFKTLKSLDLRGSPVGDSEVTALGWLPHLEKLWLSARRTKRPSVHAHYADDERAEYVQLHEWEAQEPDYFKQKANLDTSMEYMESGMGEPIPTSNVTDECSDTNNERSQSKDRNGNEASKEEKDKKGSKRKPDKGTGDDTDNNGESSRKRRCTSVKILFEGNTFTKRVFPYMEDENPFCIFGGRDEAYNRNGEHIVIRNRSNENNANNNNNERRNDENNIAPLNFEFNLINPMGSIDDVGNVEIDISLNNVSDRRKNLRNIDRDNANNRNGNDNGEKECRHRYKSNENPENQQNDRPNQPVDCINIDQLIDASDVSCGSQNEVIVIESSPRPTNEPSTSKGKPDGNQKAPNTNKPESQGYVHFRRNQNPVVITTNREESNEDSKNKKDEKKDVNRSVSNDVRKDDDVREYYDESEMYIVNTDLLSERVLGPKPGPSEKPVNEGASTSKVGKHAEKVKRATKNIRDLIGGPEENMQIREPLPPVQYQIEPRHHVLYVGAGPQLNTYRFPRDASDLLRHLNFIPAHVDPSGLVTDFSIRRFGRAHGEDVNIIHIGPAGPMLVGQAAGARPDRSNLRFLSVTGYRNVTDRSLVHLATAAPNLTFIDFSETGVTENGVENFKSLRPECEIVFSQCNKNEEE